MSAKAVRSDVARYAAAIILAAGAAVFGWGKPEAAGIAQTPLRERLAPSATDHRNLIQQYCVTCHGSRLRTAGIDLETADLGATPVASNPELWERVVRKLGTGTMPPQAVPRPDQRTLDSLLARVEQE